MMKIPEIKFMNGRSFRTIMSGMAMLFSLLVMAGPDDTAKSREYRQKLQKEGFPKDYVVALAKLHRLYPKWKFKALLVTKMEPKYTWDFVLAQETDNPARSLISASQRHAAFWHATDTNDYDSGCRRASAEAVAYFLDPRNWLNERDIFQFEDLACSGNFKEKDIQSVLRGTTWENFTLENGKTVNRYILDISKQLNISPLHVASRLRQEQGNGTPLVGGKCGTLINKYYNEQMQSDNGRPVVPPAPGSVTENLRSYDNLFNFFNIEACGTGKYTIYLNGLKEARKGTPEMAKKWGGPEWNKRWKAIYGGALKLSANYISNYQNTRYLQKWNVDNRCKTPKGNSRNFWGQYMQNIEASFSEAVHTYTALHDSKLLNLPFTFLIPVYSGMPPQISGNPSIGKGELYMPLAH